MQGSTRRTNTPTSQRRRLDDPRLLDSQSRLWEFVARQSAEKHARTARAIADDYKRRAAAARARAAR